MLYIFSSLVLSFFLLKKNIRTFTQTHTQTNTDTKHTHTHTHTHAHTHTQTNTDTEHTHTKKLRYRTHTHKQTQIQNTHTHTNKHITSISILNFYYNKMFKYKLLKIIKLLKIEIYNENKIEFVSFLKCRI